MTSRSSHETPDTAALVDHIIAELQTRFRTSVTNLKSAIAAYVQDGTLPPADAAATGLFDYPALRVTTSGEFREGQGGHNL
ncbi:MAG TPA: AMP nucleosidase, partial [Sphingopyxis sp.]|nr:AMP nucleosidase [Sphingopyxis sp.]